MKPYRIYCVDGDEIKFIKSEGTLDSAQKYVEYLKTLPEYAGKDFFIRR